MLSNVVETARRIKSYLSLKHRIPTYMERADYYRQRAILESVKNGVRIDRDKGVDLIDVTDATAIKLPNGNQIEFARNGDGIRFARIEGGKYYPIDTNPSEDLLEKSRYFERLTKSYWMRLLREPSEFFYIGSIIHSLDVIKDTIYDSNVTLELLMEALKKASNDPQQSTEPLEQTVRELHDKSD